MYNRHQPPTSINNYSFYVICVPEGAVPEEEIIIGEGHSLPRVKRNGAREVVYLGGGGTNLHQIVELWYFELFLLHQTNNKQWKKGNQNQTNENLKDND